MTRMRFGSAIFIALACVIWVSGRSQSTETQLRKVTRPKQVPPGPVFSRENLGRDLPAKWRTLRASSDLSTWAFAFDGDRADEARGILAMDDGGCLFWGNTRILGGGSCAWLNRLDSGGDVEWSRVYAVGSNFFSVEETADGGLIIAGNYHGSQSLDACLIKLDASGDAEWGVVLGSPSGDTAHCARQTSDGGYIAAGITNILMTSDFGDFWTAKLDSAGNVEWSYFYRGEGNESDWLNDTRQLDIRQTDDDGYLLAGDSDSFGGGNRDICLLKLSPLGAIEWQRAYGGPGAESFYVGGPHLQLLPDGRVLVVCTTSSYGAGGNDGWVFCLDSQGEFVWQEAIGGSGDDRINSLHASADGGFILAGGSSSFGNFDRTGAWILKITADGALDMHKAYGLAITLRAQAVDESPDGSILAAGYQSMSAGTVWYMDNTRDALVMRASPAGDIGSPTNAFVSDTITAVSVTNASPQDAGFIIYPGFAAGTGVGIGFSSVSPSRQLLSWGSVQPPDDVSLYRETNRGLFKGEASNTLTWTGSAWNEQYVISAYRVYRRSLDVEGSPYSRIASVPGNILGYCDANLDISGKFSYYITSVDAQGIESPPSASVGN